MDTRSVAVGGCVTSAKLHAIDLTECAAGAARRAVDEEGITESPYGLAGVASDPTHVGDDAEVGR